MSYQLASFVYNDILLHATDERNADFNYTLGKEFKEIDFIEFDALFGAIHVDGSLDYAKAGLTINGGISSASSVKQLDYSVGYYIDDPVMNSDGKIKISTRLNDYFYDIDFDGPTAGLKATLDYGFKFKPDVNIFGFINNSDVSVGGTIELFNTDKLLSSSRGWGDSYNPDEYEIPKNVQNIYSSDIVGIEFNPNFTDGFDKKYTVASRIAYDPSAKEKDLNFEFTAKPEKYLANGTLDIDDLVGKFVKPAQWLDMYDQFDDFKLLGNTYTGTVGYSLLSANAVIGMKPYLQLSSDITSIGVKLLDGSKVIASGKIGDDFLLDSSYKDKQISFQTYLDGDLKLDWGLEFEGGLEFTIGGIKVDGFGPIPDIDHAMLKVEPKVSEDDWVKKEIASVDFQDINQQLTQSKNTAVLDLSDYDIKYDANSCSPSDINSLFFPSIDKLSSIGNQGDFFFKSNSYHTFKGNVFSGEYHQLSTNGNNSNFFVSKNKKYIAFFEDVSKQNLVVSDGLMKSTIKTYEKKYFGDSFWDKVEESADTSSPVFGSGFMSDDGVFYYSLIVKDKVNYYSFSIEGAQKTETTLPVFGEVSPKITSNTSGNFFENNKILLNDINGKKVDIINYKFSNDSRFVVILTKSNMTESDANDYASDPDLVLYDFNSSKFYVLTNRCCTSSIDYSFSDDGKYIFYQTVNNKSIGQVYSQFVVFNPLLPKEENTKLLSDECKEETYTPTLNATNIIEGNSGEKNMVFTLTLDKAANQDITATYATRQANSTATSGEDYKSVSGTVTIAKGQTSATINVPIIGDTTFEGDEAVGLVISNVKGAKLANGANSITATGTIKNDDAEPMAFAEILDSYTTEGDSGYKTGNVKITLNNAYSKDIKIGYSVIDGSATLGKDYNVAGATNGKGSVTIKAGETSALIAYQVLGDSEVENTESFTIKIDSYDNNLVEFDWLNTGSTVYLLDNDYSKDTLAPKLVSKTVKDDKLTLTYNEKLSDIIPSVTQFAVMVNGVKRNVISVAYKDTAIDLTLSQTVTASDKVTLNYFAETSDSLFAIQDAAGNDAFPETNLDVTNLTGNTGTPKDTTRPTASLSLSDTDLKAGETASLTIVFSEAVTGLSLSDFTVTGGSLSGLFQASDVEWIATFTPATNTTTTGNIQLKSASYQDLAGNTNTSAATVSVNVNTLNNSTKDTTPPTASLSLSDTDLKAGETASLSILFSEAVTGLSLSDFTVSGGSLSGLFQASDVEWIATFTPATNTTTTGNIQLKSASYQDLASNTNTSAATVSVNVNTLNNSTKTLLPLYDASKVPQPKPASTVFALQLIDYKANEVDAFTKMPVDGLRFDFNGQSYYKVAMGSDNVSDLSSYQGLVDNMNDNLSWYDLFADQSLSDNLWSKLSFSLGDSFVDVSPLSGNIMQGKTILMTYTGTGTLSNLGYSNYGFFADASFYADVSEMPPSGVTSAYNPNKKTFIANTSAINIFSATEGDYVLGSRGNDLVVMKHNTHVNANVESVNFAKNYADMQIAIEGTKVHVYDSTGFHASVALQSDADGTSFGFNDKTIDIRLVGLNQAEVIV